MADDTYSRGYRNDPHGRGGAGASGQATDPLTELARLIGQSDPFAPDAGHDRRPDGRAATPHAAEWRNDAPHSDPHYDNAAPYDDLGGTPDPQQDSEPYADSQYRATGGEALPTDPHHDQGYGDSHDGQGDDGATEHAQGQDEDYGRFYDDPPTPRRRGGLITAAALIGLAVIGTAGAFAYRAVFTSSGPPSIIARDAGPNKIVPATQNTDNSSNKQIYDRAGDRGQNERIVSREEQPLNPADPARAAPPRPAAQSLSAAIAAMPGGLPARSGFPPDASALAPTAPGSGGEPKKIRTVTIKSDQSPGDTVHPVAPPRPVAPQAAAQPPAASRSATAAPTPSAPLSLSPQSAPSAAPSPPARAAALAPPPPAAAAGDSAGGYFVQVAAQKTQEEAQATYRGIQAKYASVLSGRQPVIRRKDLGSKGVFYGAQVGPFSREDAVQLCDSLKSAGATCMIQRN